MDIPSLAVVLQTKLSPNPAERKAAEESLNKVLLLIWIEVTLEIVFNHGSFKSSCRYMFFLMNNVIICMNMK